MNGAEKIKERILADARALSEKILEDAEREAQSIIGSAEREAFKRVTIMTEKAKEEAIHIKQRLMAVSGLENRKRALKAKQDCVDEAFDMALSRLANLPDEKYSRFLEEILINAVKDGEGEIIFNTRDNERLGQKFVKSINERLKKLGGKASLTLAKETLKSYGGFVLKYGDMELNCTLEILLAMERPVLESEVAAILF